MASLVETLGIDRLSVTERLQLVQEIWDNIAPAVEQLPLTQADRDELDRRLAALEADPTNIIPWEEVEAGARAVAQMILPVANALAAYNRRRWRPGEMRAPIIVERAETAHENAGKFQLHLPGLLKVLAEHLYSTQKVGVRELLQNAHDSCVRRAVEYAEPGYRPRH